MVVLTGFIIYLSKKISNQDDQIIKLSNSIDYLTKSFLNQEKRIEKEIKEKERIEKEIKEKGITLPFEVADGIALAVMIDHRNLIRKELKAHTEKGEYMHPEDLTFNIGQLMPALNLNIAAPVESATTLPVRPNILEVAVPEGVDPPLPDVPSLASIVIPTEPDLALPSFDAVLGNAPLVPNITFAWAEAPYQSALLNDVTTQLQAWVNGASTGLAPAVEAAIWNRMRDREQVTAAQGVNEVLETFSVRGFSRPPGAVSDRKSVV